MFLLIKFSDRLAFPVIWSMWEFQDRPLEISTPKYFALVTTSRTWPCNLYIMLTDFLDVVTRTTWHLEGLNSKSHRSSHTESLSRSFCSSVPSSEPPIVRYTAVSSANKRTWDDNSSGRSFIYWNTSKTQHLLRCRFLPDDQIFPIIDIDICMSDHLASIRRQNQNVLSDACRDVEKNQE